MRNKISKAIKNFRKEEGISMEAFARLVGVSINTVSRWENKGQKPSPLSMSRLEDLLGEEVLRCKRKR